MVPRGEQGIRDINEKAVRGIETGMETGRMTSAGMATRAGMGAKKGAGTGTRRQTRVEGRKGLGTFEVVIEVGHKNREEGRRQ